MLDAQLPQAEEAEEAATWLSPPGPEDLETNPHLDMSRARSWLSQPGQDGTSLPITRVSNSLPQLLQVYS